MKNVDEQEKILRAEGAVRRSILTVPMGDVTFVYCEWDIVEGPFVGLPLYTYGYKFDYKGNTYGDYVELSDPISIEILAAVLDIFAKQIKKWKEKIDKGE